MTTRDRTLAPQTSTLPFVLPDEVGAIAVDTNVYKEYGFRVRSLPLAELRHVKDLGFQWLVPEFWELELRRHMTENGERVTTLRRDLEKAREWADTVQLEHADKLAAALAASTGESVAHRLLDEHYLGAKPLRLRTAWNAGPGILDDYFASRHPFETSGSKRKEFPDAFALATLSAWAEKNGKRVLVVTNDAGCLRACAASEHLVGSKSLTEALSALRSVDASRKAVIGAYERLLSSDLRTESSDLRRELTTAIRHRLIDLELEIEYWEEAGRECEHELTALEIERIEPVGYDDGSLELRVFSATLDELSFSCELQVWVEATARFARVYRGSRRLGHLDAPDVEATGTVVLEAIVTMQPDGALSASSLRKASVRRIELKVRKTDIDFGGVEAWEPRYEEE